MRCLGIGVSDWHGVTRFPLGMVKAAAPSEVITKRANGQRQAAAGDHRSCHLLRLTLARSVPLKAWIDPAGRLSALCLPLC